MARSPKKTPPTTAPLGINITPPSDLSGSTTNAPSPLGYGANEPFPKTMRVPSTQPFSIGGINWGSSGAQGAPHVGSNQQSDVPLFYAGDEYAPLNTPQIVPQLQQMLVEAGLLKASDVRPGVWDDSSATAYRKVLSLANRNHKDGYQMLAELASNPTLGQTTATTPTIYQITNPTELRESFRQAFIDRTGRTPPQAATDAFVNQYHWQELQAQKAQNDAQPGSTVTVTAPPSQASAAQELIRNQYAAQEQAYSGLQRYNAFFDMLKSIA